MVKSFKKAIACLVAVLMVVCSMPFTAFAAELDDINVDLIFSPVYMTGYQTASDEDMLAANTDYFKYTMLNEAPLTFNSKVNGDTISGNLVLEAEKQKYIAEYNEEDPIEEDLEYGVGDYFAVTVVAENVSTLFATQNYIQYSENIEPAGYAEWTVGTGKKAVAHKGLASVSEADAKGAKITNGGLAAVDDFSAVNIYDDVDTVMGNMSSIDAANRIIKSNNQGKPAGVDVSSVDAENEYTNPATGEIGCTFDNTMICNTFIFKIVDEGDISFSVYDTDNSKVASYGGAYFAQTRDEGYHTYAKAEEDYPNGSTKLTYFGKNINRQDVEPECDHKNTTTVRAQAATCTVDGYTGDVVCADCTPEVIVTEGKVIKATGHSFTNYVSNEDATCTADGTKTADCDNGCGETDTITDEGTMTEHSFTNYVSNEDATCTADGTKTAICDNCTAEDTIPDQGSMLGHNYTSSVTTPATCTTNGVTTYTCQRCFDEYTENIPAATGHSFTNYVSDGNATCTADGTKTATCDNDGCAVTDTVPDEGSMLGHAFTNYVPDGNATCTADGTKTATCDNGCGETDTIADADSATGHAFTNYVSDGNATCTADGTKTAACDNGCGETDTITDEGSMLGHAFTNYVSNNDATCTADGTKTAACDNGCGETDTIADTGSATGHSFTNYVSDNNATVTTDGTKTATCDNGCGETDTIADQGTALGVNVTINESDLGDVTPAYGVTNVAYGSTVTVTASPLAGCTFIGFEINGKIVCTEPTYTFEVYKDVTINPIFQEEGSDTVSIIFYDKYNNVIKEFDHAITADEWPTAPIYAGYTFSNWSIPVGDINESTTVQAYYSAKTVEEESFKVTTIDGVELTVNRGEELDAAGLVDPGKVPENATKGYKVTFDTKATVTAAGATAWTVDGNVVGYGESYSFFVGSDIHVEPVFDAVEATATVTMIKNYRIDTSSHKIMFLASMKLPEGFKQIDHGFIYGKNLTADELVLENVGNTGAQAGAGVVKKTMTGATLTNEQFGLTYGIKAEDGKAVAVAYLTFIKDGVETTIYSDASVFDYTIAVNDGEDD